MEAAREMVPSKENRPNQIPSVSFPVSGNEGFAKCLRVEDGLNKAPKVLVELWGNSVPFFWRSVLFFAFFGTHGNLIRDPYVCGWH